MTTPVWTDELKTEAAEMYVERIAEYEEDKRPAASAEVLKSIADELGFTVNSVRAIVQRAKDPDGNPIYVKAAKAAKSGAAASSGKKLSKADAQAELVSALKDGNAEVSDELVEVIEKMTGKAAQLLAAAIRTIGE